MCQAGVEMHICARERLALAPAYHTLTYYVAEGLDSGMAAGHTWHKRTFIVGRVKRVRLPAQQEWPETWC